jgi:hypothetical protein
MRPDPARLSHTLTEYICLPNLPIQLVGEPMPVFGLPPREPLIQDVRGKRIMTSEAIKPTKAATGYRLIARIIQCSAAIQEGNPDILRKHLKVMRKLLSLANGIGRMTFKGWVDYQQRVSPAVSDVSLTLRTNYMLQNIMKDLNEVPPEFVEPITARLQLILTTLNAIGRTLWREWRDYDANF